MSAVAEKLVENEATLWPVPSAEVRRVWPYVAPMLEKHEHFAHGILNVQDMYNCLVEADMQLWLAVRREQIDACLVTQIVNYPQKKVCRAVFVCGKGMDYWYPWLPTVDNWARQNGCTEWEAWTHERLAKVLERKGWARQHVVMTRGIGHE